MALKAKNELKEPESFFGAVAFFARCIWCMIAHRRDHLFTKRMSALDVYWCPHCGLDHLKPRPDLFD